MSTTIRDSYWIWAVKVIASLFQIPATWNVFSTIFRNSGRPEWEVEFSTFFAIVLIDVFILAVSYIIESPELTPGRKVPWVLVAVGLLTGIIWIGIKDEGPLAWVPRLGLIGLISADVFSWFYDLVATYNSREAIEQRIRDRQVIKRRKQMEQAWSKSFKKLAPRLEELQTARELRTLGIEDFPPMVEDSPIVQLASGAWSWLDEEGQVHDTTATGKPYTKAGATRAHARHSRSL